VNATEKMKYYEVTAPGMKVIKNFRSKDLAEAFAQNERRKRMKDLKAQDSYTQGEIKGETTYRTYGIIVREKVLEFSDGVLAKDTEDETILKKDPWGNLLFSNRSPNGF